MNITCTKQFPVIFLYICFDNIYPSYYSFILKIMDFILNLTHMYTMSFNHIYFPTVFLIPLSLSTNNPLYIHNFLFAFRFRFNMWEKVWDFLNEN
jgi:hypothetical protein